MREIATFLGPKGTMPDWLNADVTVTLELLAASRPALLMRAQREGTMQDLLEETTKARQAEFEAIVSRMGDRSDENVLLCAQEELRALPIDSFIPESFKSPSPENTASQD